ncbi:MAG: RNase H-like domain-containing protein [Sedimenticola sp.]
MELAGIPPPVMKWEDTNLSDAWGKFEQHVKLIFSGPLKSKSEEEQVSYLLLWVGDKGRDIHSTWTDITADDRKLLKTYYDRYKGHVQPKLNPIFARYKFNNITQEDANIETFVTKLRLGARDCNFAANSDEMVRDRIVFGTSSKRVREKLINIGADLTLDKAIQIAQGHEYAMTQLESMSPRDAPDVSYVKPGRKQTYISQPRRTYQWQPNQGTGASTHPNQGAKGSSKPPWALTQKNRPFDRKNSDKCGNCGGNKHTRDQCPAKGQTCFKCGRMNHFKEFCRSGRKVYGINVEIDSSSGEEESNFYVDTVTSCFDSTSQPDQAFANVTLGPSNTHINFKIDTGSQVNIIPKHMFYDMNIKHPLAAPRRQLSSYTGNHLQVIGSISLHCSHNAKQTNAVFYVVDTKAPPLIGLVTSKELGLIKLIYSLDTADNARTDGQTKTARTGGQAKTEGAMDVMSEFKDVFQGIGLFPGTCKLHLKPDAVPVINPPRRVPLAMKNRLKTELQVMEKNEVIARVTRPTDWVNSLVLIEKPKSGNLRICLDPKMLNEALLRPHYPTRTLDDVVSQLAGSSVFSVLDAKSGYWSIRLDEESSYYTVFNSPFGRYRFLRMPFGVKVAQDVFERKMDETFEGLNGVLAIVDDILVYGKNKEEHDRNLRNVMTRARESGIKLNADKCKIGMTEVPYFGHVISSEGLKPDPNKVKAIKDMPTPQNRKELETICGMINYLTKFGPNLSELTAPLRDLLKQDVEFSWDSPQEEAFDKIKSVITQSPVLAFFDPKKPLTLQTDASKHGIGFTLMQDGRPIAYGSKSLTSSQMAFAQIEKELLSIVVGFKHFHNYCYGRHVNVQNDHKPLEAIMKKPLLASPARLQRMRLTLQQYDMDVHYVPGKEVPVADALSRQCLSDTQSDIDVGLDLHVHTVRSSLAVGDNKLDQIRQATCRDTQFQVLIRVILDGWPDIRNKCPKSIIEYWNHRDEVCVYDGIIYRGENIMIPKSMRDDMISAVHFGHMGVQKCISRAKSIMFWPGMIAEITQLVLQCEICSKYRMSNQKEPLLPHCVPHRPWEIIAADLFTWNNQNYLVCVDYYSRFF